MEKVSPNNQYERRTIFSFDNRWANIEFFSFLGLVMVYTITITIYQPKMTSKNIVETSENIVASVSRFIPVAIFLVLFIFEGVVSIVSILLMWYKQSREKKALEVETRLAETEARLAQNEMKLDLWRKWNQRRIQARNNGEPFYDPEPEG